MASRDGSFRPAVFWIVTLVIGAADWIVLVAIPARDNPNLSGGSYFVALFLSALALGVVAPRGHYFQTSAVLVLPAIVLTGWTAPKGDNDGLWTLWFLFLVVGIGPTAGCNWLGRTLNRGLRLLGRS